MEGLVSLEDICPAERVVELSVGKMKVHKIGSGEIGRLLIAYPGLAMLASLREGQQIDEKTLITIATSIPDAVPAIVAAALGRHDVEGVKLARRRIPATDELKIISASFDISFPGGLESFLAVVGEFTGAARPASPTPTVEEDMVVRGDVVELKA